VSFWAEHDFSLSRSSKLASDAAWRAAVFRAVSFPADEKRSDGQGVEASPCVEAAELKCLFFFGFNTYYFTRQWIYCKKGRDFFVCVEGKGTFA